MANGPLIRAANATAAEADRLSAAFAKQLSKVLRDVDRSVRDWLSEGKRPSTRSRAQIRRIVQASGYDTLAEAATSGPFNQMAGRAITARRAAGLEVAVSDAMLARLETWRLWHLDDLLTEASVITRGLGDVVMRSRGRARSRLPQDIEQVLDRAEARVQTLYDTAVSVYGRQVEAEQAGDDPATTFLAVGPVDAKTRDFCLEHVGKVYTRAEIDELDNGQISSVFLTFGGWNCRHQWVEISKFSELHESREAPEIRDAVADLLREAA